jgi:hypothetical protein
VVLPFASMLSSSPSPGWLRAGPRRRASLLFLCWAALPALASPLRAAPPAPADNLFKNNPGFESTPLPADNLWDGVNSDGTLAGFGYSAHVVTENGGFNGLAMPPSVAFVDLNGDGRPDLITADPTGVFRFYPNSGTPTAPKFTSAEIIPLYVSMTQSPDVRTFGFNDYYTHDGSRFCPKFALADWRHTGLLDLLIGNYYGEVFFVPNTGTAKRPLFQLGGGADMNDLVREKNFAPPKHPPTSAERARISTNDQGRYWCNLLSPVAQDWTGHGKLDLICGEGTYSANAIHLLENVGTDTPKFSSTHHTIIAYGDGREQLLATVADLNGDGQPDLIVADRSGQVGLYLSTAKPAPGVELERTSTLTFGGASKLPGLCSLYAADYNGDGLIDLIIGLPSGHLAVSLNTGTKTQPSFGPIQEIKGVDRLGRNILSPPGWACETSTYYGNVLSYFTVVNAQDDPASKPPEGARCLKAGYWPSPGETFPMPAEGIPGTLKHFMLEYKGLTLDVNKHYHVSFQAMGSGVERLRWEFQATFNGYPDPVGDKNARGGVENGSGHLLEVDHFGSGFSVGSNWAEVQGEITPKYRSDAMRDRKTMEGTFVLEFWAQNLSSVLYLDDFRLTANQ